MIVRGNVLVSHVKAHLCRALPPFSAFLRHSHADCCPNSIFLFPIHPTFPTVFDPTKIVRICYGVSPARPICCADTGVNSSLPFSPVFSRIFPCFAARSLYPQAMLAAAKEVIPPQRLGMPERSIASHLTVMAIMIVVILTQLVIRAYSGSQIQLNSGRKKATPLRSGSIGSPKQVLKGQTIRL